MDVTRGFECIRDFCEARGLLILRVYMGTRVNFKFRRVAGERGVSDLKVSRRRIFMILDLILLRSRDSGRPLILTIKTDEAPP